jgi:signal transduction histidine kinase
MGAWRAVRAHVDSLVAVALAVAYLAWLNFADAAAPAGPPFLAGLDAGQDAAIAAAVVFLLSLALRTRWPLVPLALAFVALAVTGGGRLDASPVLLAGLLLACWSVAAWSSGRVALVGALGVGLLVGASALRVAEVPMLPRDVALPASLLGGAWLLGLVARSMRAARGDERVIGGTGWDAPRAVVSLAARDQAVRELRDTVERTMSVVILQSRAAGRVMGRDATAARAALAAVEGAGTEALEETQRIAGLLLSPDGARLPDLLPGIADIDQLALALSDAGLPVTTRVEGRPVPLSAELDAVAYRVADEALRSTLEHTVDAQASVVVRYGRDELQVEVLDDGVPLAEDAIQETAGLLAVRDEVVALGGSLDAGPAEGRGYWVLARLPYEPEWP